MKNKSFLKKRTQALNDDKHGCRGRTFFTVYLHCIYSLIFLKAALKEKEYFAQYFEVGEFFLELCLVDDLDEMDTRLKNGKTNI